jgi:hypothetical protein
MLFDKKLQKLPQTGSSSISVTVNDRESGPKLNDLFLMILDELFRKLTRDREWSYVCNGTAWTRRTGTKVKVILMIFDENPQNYPRPEVVGSQ